LFTVKKTEPTALDTEIDKLLTALAPIAPTEDDYKTVADHLITIHKLRETELSRKRVSSDKAAEVVGSILGILAIVMYEQKHVFTSKALGFVTKIR
jgi:hypothetical protein